MFTVFQVVCSWLNDAAVFVLVRFSQVIGITGNENFNSLSGQLKSDFANLYQIRVELPILELAMVYAEFIIIKNIIFFFGSPRR